MDNEGQWEDRPFAVPTHPCPEAYFSFPLQRWAIRRYLSCRVDKMNARPMYWYGTCALPCPAPACIREKRPRVPRLCVRKPVGTVRKGLTSSQEAHGRREVCRPPSCRPPSLLCWAGLPSTLNAQRRPFADVPTLPPSSHAYRCTTRAAGTSSNRIKHQSVTSLSNMARASFLITTTPHRF